RGQGRDGGQLLLLSGYADRRRADPREPALLPPRASTALRARPDVARRGDAVDSAVRALALGGGAPGGAESSSAPERQSAARPGVARGAARCAAGGAALAVTRRRARLDLPGVAW